MSKVRLAYVNISNALTLRRSRLNCSESTAGSRIWSGSEFQTENARLSKCATVNLRNWQWMTSGRWQKIMIMPIGTQKWNH